MLLVSISTFILDSHMKLWLADMNHHTKDDPLLLHITFKSNCSSLSWLFCEQSVAFKLCVSALRSGAWPKPQSVETCVRVEKTFSARGQQPLRAFHFSHTLMVAFLLGLSFLQPHILASRQIHYWYVQPLPLLTTYKTCKLYPWIVLWYTQWQTPTLYNISNL